MEKTGAKIEMSSNKDQSLTFLITGKQETVLKARRELLVSFQTQASHSIAVPKDHHRYILGRGGSKLQELEQKTATKISLPKVILIFKNIIFFLVAMSHYLDFCQRSSASRSQLGLHFIAF